MLSEQKSWRKSSVEMEVYPYKSLTTPYFLLRFPQRFLAEGNKKPSVMPIRDKQKQACPHG